MRREKLDYPFFIVPYAVFYDKRLKHIDVRVYLAYISRCMRSNHTEVGEATLARDLSSSLSTIRRSVARLVKMGLIVKRRRMNTSSVTEIVDVRNLYEDIGKSYFNTTPKVTKAKKKKSPSGHRRDDGEVTSDLTVRSPVRCPSGHQRDEKYIKGDQIKSEVDKDPPAGAKTQTYEKARDGSRYEYRRLDRLPGVPQTNLDAFVAIAAKQCAEHGIEEESHIISAVGKGISCLADWNEKERLRDTVACFRKVIGNIVYDISQKVHVKNEPTPTSVDWSLFYENPEE